VLKWSIGELKIRFRTNLSKHLIDQYLKNYTYYKMSNLDNRIANADQLLTTDIDKFCESTVDLYSNTCKPMLDVFIYIYRTTSTIGVKTPMMIMMVRWF
jgi:ATP-binding cassette subfamily D (ALD) protein 3